MSAPRTSTSFEKFEFSRCVHIAVECGYKASLGKHKKQDLQKTKRKPCFTYPNVYS